MAYNPHAVNRLRFWIATGEITSLDTLTFCPIRSNGRGRYW